MATFKALTAYESEWFRIVEKAGVRSVRIDLGRTNEVEARRHGLDLEAWRSEMVRASLVDPTKLQREGAGITRTLSRGRDLRITHPNGTDLRLRLRGRRPRLHDGLVDAADQESGDVFELLPSGWVIVAIDERFAEGAMVANVASTVAAGGDDVEATEKVVGGRWRFRDGKLVEYGYAEGGDEFARIYRRLGEGKERPGTISIGLNPEIHDLPGMEDQVRGRITLAIGRNAQHGGSTQTPYFHSYLVVDGASLQVDEKTILKDGEIV